MSRFCAECQTLQPQLTTCQSPAMCRVMAQKGTTMTDRVHFDDLTKIDVEIGRLGDDTYNRLRAHDGPIELWCGCTQRWVACLPLKWGVSTVYRAQPLPLTKPDVPWEHVVDWVQYVARDKNGEGFGYESEPTPCDGMWRTDGGFASLESHKIDLGTCDWRDSLVKRPGGL